LTHRRHHKRVDCLQPRATVQRNSVDAIALQQTFRFRVCAITSHSIFPLNLMILNTLPFADPKNPSECEEGRPSNDCRRIRVAVGHGARGLAALSSLVGGSAKLRLATCIHDATVTHCDVCIRIICTKCSIGQLCSFGAFHHADWHRR
jgi:hypothetical protein